MTAQLRKAWAARAPRERTILLALALTLAAVIYVWVVLATEHARVELRGGIKTLRAQAVHLEQQAAEFERLRAAPPVAAAQTDLRALVQAQAGAAGLSSALVKIDAPDADQVLVVFGAVPFADWLNWVSSLQAQHVRLDACRIEALALPGMVSVSATLLRAKAQ